MSDPDGFFLPPFAFDRTQMAQCSGRTVVLNILKTPVSHVGLSADCGTRLVRRLAERDGVAMSTLLFVTPVRVAGRDGA